MPILPSMASLDWITAFGVHRFNPNFVPEDLPENIRRTLKADPFPQETAQCVAVEARSRYLGGLESQVYATNTLETAEEKMKEFLLGHPVVQTPQYKQTLYMLTQNLTTAKRNHQEVLQQVEKLRIVLETAISVALSKVSYPCQEEHASANDANDADDANDAGCWDDEAQRASLDRLDAELYGQYLHLVRDLQNRYNSPRW